MISLRYPHPRPASSAFAGYRFPPEVITLAVRWYLRFGLSYRDVEELLAERGIEVDHVTIYRWVHRFAPEFAEAARARQHLVGDRWYFDETYLKVGGTWLYLFRATDQFGQARSRRYSLSSSSHFRQCPRCCFRGHGRLSFRAHTMTCTMVTPNRMAAASRTSFSTFSTVSAWIGSPPSRKTSAPGRRGTTPQVEPGCWKGFDSCRAHHS